MIVELRTREEFEEELAAVKSELADANDYIDQLNVLFAELKAENERFRREMASLSDKYSDLYIRSRTGAANTAIRQRDEARAALAEARKALEPFAEASRRFDEATERFGVPLTPDHRKPRTEFTHGDLRSARRVREGGKADG